MDQSAVAKSEEVRYVELPDWGKVIMEELLFRAALQLADQPASGGTVSISMRFDVSATPTEKLLEISAPAALEHAIVTRVALAAKA